MSPLPLGEGEGEGFQRFSHFFGALRPLRGVLLQQAQDQGFERGRAIGAVPAGGDRWRVEVLADDRHALVPHERRPAADHLIEHGAQCVEVGAGRDLAAHGLLRRHVAHRADHHAGLGQPRTVGGHRQAPVADLGSAVGGQPDVAWLDVAVDDVLLVRERQPRSRLYSDLDGLLQR